jgi:hypothetical protein
MTLYVTEHSNSVAGRYRQPSTPTGAKAGYQLSTGASVGVPGSAGVAPQPGSQFIRVSADIGMFLCLNLTSSGTTLTSTNSYKIPPNAPPEFFAISTGYLVQAAAST